MIGLPRWYSNAYRQAHEGLNYRLRSLSGGRWAGYCRPANIGVMMTNLCNARCVHCDIWKNKGREETPTVEQWQTVLSDLRSWLGPVHIFLSGGEALLRPATLELLAHGSSVGLLMEVLTHGYWDDQSRIEKVALKIEEHHVVADVAALGHATHGLDPINHLARARQHRRPSRAASGSGS